MNREWLKNLKVGDRVVVQGAGFSHAQDYVTAVARLTKTLIITEKGGRFRRESGDSLSKGYECPFLREPTSPVLDRIKHGQLARKLQHFDWKQCELSILEKVYDLLGG